MAFKLVAEPYKGDDWAQAMARTWWLPMFAMGLMAVGAGVATGVIGGLEFGEFFGGGSPDDFGRASVLVSWTTGLVFLGMSLILGTITMTLVNIIRTLRDTGRDVQQSVGAREILKLKKPWEGRLTPYVLMMGVMVVMGGFVVAIWQAVLLGDLPAAGLANPGNLGGADLADFGTAQAINGWLRPVLLFGLALIFTSIVLALRTIIKTISYQAQRVEEMAEETGRAVSA